MKCNFKPAWIDGCKENAEQGERYCENHLNTTCDVCGKQATRECEYVGQFVCGTPLCNDCEGWNDIAKSSGNWGFLNHFHRRREVIHSNE